MCVCVTVEEVRVNSTPLVISLVGQLATNITKPTGVRIYRKKFFFKIKEAPKKFKTCRVQYLDL